MFIALAGHSAMLYSRRVLWFPKSQTNGGADNANRIIANRKYFVCSAIRTFLIRLNKGTIFCEINLFTIYIILNFNAFTTVNINADIEKHVYIIIVYFKRPKYWKFVQIILRMHGMINVLYGFICIYKKTIAG